MNYYKIINHHLPLNKQISSSCNIDTISHQDAITILSQFYRTNQCKLEHSLYLIAFTFRFLKQLENNDRKYLESKHSYDAEILSDFTYPYSFFVRYLHAIVRRHYFEPINISKDTFAINKLEKLLIQLDQNIDENELKYNSLLGNSPHSSIRLSNNLSSYNI